MNQNKNEKTKKLQNIIELKREPYPHFFAKKHSLHTILKEQETYHSNSTTFSDCREVCE